MSEFHVDNGPAITMHATLVDYSNCARSKNVRFGKRKVVGCIYEFDSSEGLSIAVQAFMGCGITRVKSPFNSIDDAVSFIVASYKEQQKKDREWLTNHQVDDLRNKIIRQAKQTKSLTKLKRTLEVLNQ